MNRKILLRAVGLLLIATVIGGGYLIWKGATTSIEAEYNLHAVIATHNALEAFVAEHKKWPSSWEELIASSKPLTGSYFELPKDADEVRSRVKVRFDVSLADLANPQVSKLIEPVGPCYSYDWRLEPLYEQISSVRDEL